MISKKSKAVTEKARKLYESEFRAELEDEHAGRYTCIEPLSGSYFLGGTFDEAVNVAIDAFPDRLTYMLRIGHAIVFHLGVLVQ